MNNNNELNDIILNKGGMTNSNKKIILAIKKGINLRFLRSIADTIIEFEDLSDLKEKMKDKLGE